LKSQVSFAKEPYKRDDILQKRHIILRSLPKHYDHTPNIVLANTDDVGGCAEGAGDLEGTLSEEVRKRTFLQHV